MQSGSGISHDFVELLRVCYEQENESYRALEAAIAAANASFGGRTINRRKLRGLLEEEDPKMCLSELEAFDVYLNRSGRSLADQVFQKKRLIQALGGRGHVTVLIGGKGTHMGPDVSYWEVKASSHLMRRLGDAAPGTTCALDSVLARTRDPDDPEETPEEVERKYEGEPWYADLFGSRAHATVSLGSSFANPASELMISDMVGCRAFDKNAFAGRPAPPFRFVWAPGAYKVRPSSFSENGGALELDREGQPEGWDTWAMRLLSSEPEAINRKVDDWDHHGVLVAQKRQSGAVWIVAAGLTGPATYAAETLMNESSIPLPAPEGAGHGAPIWVAYKVRVSKKEQETGDLAEGPLQPIVIPDEEGNTVRRLPVLAPE